MGVLFEIENKGESYKLVSDKEERRLCFIPLSKKEINNHRFRKTAPFLVALTSLITLAVIYVILPVYGILNFKDIDLLESMMFFISVFIVSAIAISALVPQNDHWIPRFFRNLNKDSAVWEAALEKEDSKGVNTVEHLLADWQKIYSQNRDGRVVESQVIDYLKSLSSEKLQSFLLDSIEERNVKSSASNLQALSDREGGSPAFKKDIRVKLHNLNNDLDKFDHQRNINTAMIINHMVNQDMINALAA